MSSPPVTELYMIASCIGKETARANHVVTDMWLTMDDKKRLESFDSVWISTAIYQQTATSLLQLTISETVHTLQLLLLVVAANFISHNEW